MVDLQEALKRRLEEQETLYQEWLMRLPEEKKLEYLNLKVFGSEYHDKSTEFHLRRCYRILDKILPMKNANGESVKPVGLAVHGSLPVVYVEVPGRDKRFENKDEVVEYAPEKDKARRFKATFDTNPFGVASERKNLGGSTYSLDWTLAD